MFYHNSDTDCLEGVIEEFRANGRLILQKHPTGHYYSDLTNNSLAQGMVKKAVEISQEEYDIASAVLEAMINTNEMYLDVNVPTKVGEIKAEPTYV